MVPAPKKAAGAGKVQFVDKKSSFWRESLEKCIFCYTRSAYLRIHLFKNHRLPYPKFSFFPRPTPPFTSWGAPMVKKHLSARIPDRQIFDQKCSKSAQKHPPDTPPNTPKVTQTFQFFLNFLLVKVGSGRPGPGLDLAGPGPDQAWTWPGPGSGPARARAWSKTPFMVSRMTVSGSKLLSWCRE